MPVTAEVTPLEENRVRIDVAVSDDEVRRKMDRAVRDMAKRMRVPGFRPGREPTQVVLKRIGPEAVMQQVLEESLGEWYAEAVQTAGVRPIDDPEVDLGEVAESGVSFSATVKLPPRPELGEYRGLEVVQEPAEVPEGALEAELDRLREQGSRLQEVERPIQEGDFAVIDYDGAIDGTALPAAATRDMLVEVGPGRLMPAFSEQLIGASAGDTRTFPVPYPPEDQRPELAGKTVEYTVRVKRVQEKVLPELDDDFAAEVSEFDTIDALRAERRRLRLQHGLQLQRAAAAGGGAGGGGGSAPDPPARDLGGPDDAGRRTIARAGGADRSERVARAIVARGCIVGRG